MSEIRISREEKEQIEGISREMRIFCDVLPVDIIKLVDDFSFTVLELSESTRENKKLNGYESHIIPKGADKEEQSLGFICVDTSDAYKQRVAIAYHFANVLLLAKKVISKNEYMKRIVVKKNIPQNSGYYMALSLLCPIDDLKDVMKDDGYDKNNYCNIADFRNYVNRYKIQAYDIMNYLRFIFEDGGVENEK